MKNKGFELENTKKKVTKEEYSVIKNEVIY